MAKGWTFAKLIADEMTVTAHCQNPHCNHRRQLDLKDLAKTIGPDTPAMHDDLAPRLKCMKCGGRQIGLTYTPKITPAGNPYLKGEERALTALLAFAASRRGLS